MVGSSHEGVVAGCRNKDAIKRWLACSWTECVYVRCCYKAEGVRSIQKCNVTCGKRSQMFREYVHSK